MMLPLVRRVSPLLAAVSFLWLGAFGDASAQQRGVVTGSVVAAENLRPLVSAQVYFPALQVGVLTNAQGRFLIQNVAPGEHEITAERIGFRLIRQTVVVRAGETVAVDFRLEERAISMEGIVVTGVAAQTPQTQVPFTVAKVNVDELTKSVMPSVAGLLQAKVAGVKVIQGSGAPGTEPSFQLRGPKSITGSQAPLVVIDGVVTNGGIADIDPADVESMEVVKGAAAAALYGSRASAGVIQITTRTGSHLREGQTQFIVRSTYQANSIEHYISVPGHHQWNMNADKSAIVDLAGKPIVLPRSSAPALNDGGNGRNAFTTFMVNPYPSSMPTVDPIRQFFDPGGSFSNFICNRS